MCAAARDGSHVRIVPARPGDLPRLLEIRHAAFAAHAPAAYSPQEVATLLTDVDPAELRRMIDAGRLFTARVGDDTVGLAGRAGTVLRHVYVDPGQARRGIGTALLRHVEADARDRDGASVLSAGVALHAESFYLANGYRLVVRATAWDGSAFLRMIKRL